MGIDIRQLRFAVLAADLGSFSSAAAVLGVKQSTLSRKVMDLEIRLGVKLFARTTRGAVTTDSGRVFIEQARRIVTDFENLQTTARAVSYGEQGRLTIGYCSSLMAGHLKLAFSDYLTRYPDVQFDGVEGHPDKLYSDLQAGSIDVAIAPRGSEEQGVLSRPIWSERLMAALYSGHKLLEQERIYWTDLRREVFVVPRQGIGQAIRNLIAARLTEQGHRPNIITQETALESVLSMVPVGRFITIATEASMGVSWPELQFRDIYDNGGTARLEFALYWREDIENPALKRFFSMMNERYPV
jgi:DNA-binding transcriptional LysR family regulator